MFIFIADGEILLPQLESSKIDDIACLKLVLIVTFGVFCLMFLVASVYILSLEEERAPILVPALYEKYKIESNSAVDTDRVRAKRDVNQLLFDVPNQYWYEEPENQWQYTDNEFEDDRNKRFADPDEYINDNYDEMYDNFGGYDSNAGNAGYYRDKRAAALEKKIHFFEDEYIRCKKSAPDHPDCEQIRARIRTSIDEWERHLDSMKAYLGLPVRADVPVGIQQRNELDMAMDADEDSDVDPYANEIDSEDFYRHAGPVHEDLDNIAVPNKYVHTDYRPNIESMLRQKTHAADNNFDHRTDFNSIDDDENDLDDDNAPNLTQPGPIGKRTIIIRQFLTFILFSSLFILYLSLLYICLPIQSEITKEISNQFFRLCEQYSNSKKNFHNDGHFAHGSIASGNTFFLCLFYICHIRL